MNPSNNYLLRSDHEIPFTQGLNVYNLKKKEKWVTDTVSEIN